MYKLNCNATRLYTHRTKAVKFNYAGAVTFLRLRGGAAAGGAGLAGGEGGGVLLLLLLLLVGAGGEGGGAGGAGGGVLLLLLLLLLLVGAGGEGDGAGWAGGGGGAGKCPSRSNWSPTQNVAMAYLVSCARLRILSASRILR